MQHGITIAWKYVFEKTRKSVWTEIATQWEMLQIEYVRREIHF